MKLAGMERVGRIALRVALVVIAIIGFAAFISYGSWTLARPGRSPAELHPINGVPVQIAALVKAAR